MYSTRVNPRAKSSWLQYIARKSFACAIIRLIFTTRRDRTHLCTHLSAFHHANKDAHCAAIVMYCHLIDYIPDVTICNIRLYFAELYVYGMMENYAAALEIHGFIYLNHDIREILRKRVSLNMWKIARSIRARYSPLAIVDDRRSRRE